MTTEILGKKIGTTGYGLMGLTWRPTPAPEEQAFAAMRASLASGNNFWNAGEFYGTPEYNSLHLLERYFTKYPEDAEKVVLSIKGGLKNMRPDGSVEYTRKSVDNCLKLLNGKKSIDIFEMARVDPDVPLETTLKELEKYVQEGKIGGIALSEVGAATIRKAVKITKIVAVEVEVSLWATDIFQNGVSAACAENNLLVVAYSPIGRGILTGEIKSYDDIKEGDFRKHLPRFQPDVFEHNLQLVKELETVSKRKGCTPAQLAINWVKTLSKKAGNPEIIPIPGATTEKRVVENSKDVILSSAEFDDIASILEKFQLKGGRYPEQMSKYTEG